MSDKQKKILTAIGGVLFVVAAALAQDGALAPKMHHACEIAMTILGALGLGVTKPLFGAQAQPAALELPPEKK